MIESLEADLKEFQDYQSALQDSEKWLLQTSFQLMAHNSLYINSLSQTLDHLRQHEVTEKRPIVHCAAQMLILD